MDDELIEGGDLQYYLTMTLAEAVTGLTTILRYSRLYGCKKCAGSGFVSESIFSKSTVCPACHGAILAVQNAQVKVRIPAGVDTGSRVRVPGQGNAAIGRQAGELYVITHVTEHKNFRRNGDSLHTQVSVSAQQLAAGAVVEIQTLADGVKRFRVPAETKEGTIFCLKGLGVPSLGNPVQRGDLFVTVRQAAPGSREEPAPGLRVFLCHSSGDKPAVRALYRRLRADGVTPWLDEEDLLPGEKWETEIPKAVRSCDIVIVCFSQGSINKRGYLQKEIRYALDAAEEQPEGTIFLIPLKLEECEIPAHLSGRQWVNFFEERGYERLMRALRKRAESLSRSF